MRVSKLFILFGLLTLSLNAQYTEHTTIVDGEVVRVLVMEGDTIVVAQLERISITAPKEFDYSDERERYAKYRRYAAVVYPYAVQGVRLYTQLSKETEGKSKRERKRLYKEISKRLEDEFETPLKNLSRTQGLILTKMMEKAIDRSFYDIIKEFKGGFSALYYNEFSKVYGYRLKDKYIFGADPVMDAVLEDFDVMKDVQQ
ncbi:MAG: DUF4294 domain-containing protein [Saprospiraceae bacterium]|nr:DUF4294 domain-containing protein [Candidatus Vicinibacter affinis]MBP6173898.1 DUF4294 domain-containing protein [Saprospiraceae bacterium]MBK6573243.1 DUF4294 domain-containing protein [Candidatus Vicinibacter affinis]MBK6822287.1 DUF4294 domain-containing protein [Candidatus Vicinibacter affinis]MBK7301926.1 DUF4294 domain-containing protein [Candidatus Vicinibacter affinis]